jgi:hypothetical protein
LEDGHSQLPDANDFSSVAMEIAYANKCNFRTVLLTIALDEHESFKCVIDPTARSITALEVFTEGIPTAQHEVGYTQTVMACIRAASVTERRSTVWDSSHLCKFCSDL